MSKLTAADYENVLLLIEAVYATPNVPGVVVCRTSLCGYTVAEIIASVRLRFPASTLTDADIQSLLLRGARSAVFNVVCSNAVSADVSECEAPSVSVPLYTVNQNMVRRNAANKVYADAFNPVPVKPLVDVVNAPIDAQICTASPFRTGMNIGLSC